MLSLNFFFLVTTLQISKAVALFVPVKMWVGCKRCIVNNNISFFSEILHHQLVIFTLFINDTIRKL